MAVAWGPVTAESEIERLFVAAPASQPMHKKILCPVFLGRSTSGPQKPRHALTWKSAALATADSHEHVVCALVTQGQTWYPCNQARFVTGEIDPCPGTCKSSQL